MTKNTKKEIIVMILATLLVGLTIVAYTIFNQKDDAKDYMTKEQIKLADEWHGLD